MRLFLCGILLFSSSQIYAWGKTGHRVVAAIAFKHIDHNTTKEIKKILGDEPIYEAALWPDRIKSDNKLRPQFSHTHYINIDKGLSVEEHLAKNAKQTNIISELARFKKILLDKKATLDEKKVALRFVIHLIGDLHQPLHVTPVKNEGGRNDYFKWFGEKRNLHAIWDENLIDMEELSFTEWVQLLDSFPKKKILESQKGNTISWAQESHDLVSKVYDMKDIDMKHFHYNYSYKHLELAQMRLRLAGYRLAAYLNQIF